MDKKTMIVSKIHKCLINIKGLLILYHPPHVGVEIKNYLTVTFPATYFLLAQRSYV